MESIEVWFDAIYQKYQKKLLRLAIHMVRDPQLAENMVPSVFLTLLTNHQRLREQPNIWG